MHGGGGRRMKFVLATLAYSVLSSVVPIFNIEVYLAALRDPDRLQTSAPARGGGGLRPGCSASSSGTGRSRSRWKCRWMKRRLDTPKRQAQLKKWEDRIAGPPVGRRGSDVLRPDWSGFRRCWSWASPPERCG